MGEPETVQRVFGALPLMLYAVEGPELRFAATTAAGRAFTGRAEPIGVPIREALPGDLGERLSEVCEKVYASGRPQVLRELRIRFDRANGERAEVLHHGRPLARGRAHPRRRR